MAPVEATSWTQHQEGDNPQGLTGQAEMKRQVQDYPGARHKTLTACGLPQKWHCLSISETREETNSPLLGLLRRSAERTRHRRSDGEFSRKRGVGVSVVGPNFYTPGYLCLSRTISWEAHNALESSRKKVGFGMGWPMF